MSGGQVSCTQRGVSMAIIGCIVILSVILSYLTMIFVLHRFTYRTWMFDVVVGAGMILGASSWFLVTRIELRILGSKELTLRVGDKMPSMAFLTTDGYQALLIKAIAPLSSE